MTKTIIGIYSERVSVNKALDKLKSEGFDPKNISIVMKDDEKIRDISDNTASDVAGGAVSGVTSGAVLGGLAGLLAGTVIPGLGTFLIGGPIATALGLGGVAATTVSGAATGAVAGGFIGALVGLGLSENEAKYYEERLSEGAILLAVPVTPESESVVTSIFTETNATDIKTADQPTEGIQKKETKRTLVDSEFSEEEYVSMPIGDYGHQPMASGIKGGKAGQGQAYANPVQIQKYLKSVDYPCTKSELLSAAELSGADQDVLRTLQDMPGDKFNSPKDVSKAIGNIG